MSLTSVFLNLSMKEQIFLSLVILTLFCILVTTSIFLPLLYEILYKFYEIRKNFFYDKYKKYIEAAFYYQSFHIMQYEEILHRIQKQILKVEQSPYIYYTIPLEDYSDYIINMTHRDLYNFTELDEKESKENPYLYIISRAQNSEVQENIMLYCLFSYQTYTNSLFSFNIYNSFTIPGYGVPIMDQPLFYNINFSTTFSYNRSKINDKYDDFYIIAPGEDDAILHMIVNEYVNSVKALLIYIRDKLEIFSQLFSKLYTEVKTFPKAIFYEGEVMNDFAKQFVGYLSTINYGEDKFFLVTSMEDDGFYYTEMNTIPNLLFFLNSDFSRSLDIDFIPFDYQSKALLSRDLCALFKIKQYFLSGKKINFEEIYNNIHHKESRLENCFIDNNLINSQEEIKDVFDIFSDDFYKNENMIYQGIFEIIPNNSLFPFYFIKYSYPNYNTLREFQTEYLFTDQVDFYAFASFKKVQKYIDHLYQVNLNIFFFIIMLNNYCWLICLVINLCIFSKVSEKWTAPITKLEEAIKTNSIKDESIFNYNYDDTINELFLTCKELLSGKISSDIGVNDFNIIGKENEKKVDKSIYNKNLIINNNLLEELINKKQKEMDCSNNIKLNEINKMFLNTNKNQEKTEQSTEKISKNSGDGTENLNEKINKTIHTNEKDKRKESYIKLFKISEYLDYYRSKLENKNILVLNDGYDEFSQLISKYSNKSHNSSISNQLNNEKDEIKENNYINMMDESNIAYLWYMEAKKKNNVFNYNINNDCNELFTEYYDNKVISHADNKKRNSSNLK